MQGKFGYHLLALIVVAVWGVTFISTKILIGEGLRPSWIFAIRFLVAYLGIWVLCALSKESRKLFSSSLRDEALFLILGISGGSVYFLTENTALAYTQACNVSFIVCSAPLFTALLSFAVKKLFKGEIAEGLEDVSGRWQLVAGTALALSGMAAVVFEGSTLRISSKGDLLALAAALCWAVYSIFMGQMTARYGSAFATRKVFFYGLVTIAPFLIGREPDLSVFARPQVWGNLLFLSLAASLGCFILWNRIMSVIGNITATNYVYLNPFFTLVSAVTLLGERLTLQSGLGCAAIIAGVVIACLLPVRKPSRPDIHNR